MPSPSSQLKHYTLHAGAGAGKTKYLIDQIFQSATAYFRTFKKFPKIIATTFTIKATGEVKERLMTKAIQDGNWPLLDFICDPSKIFVSTLHGILHAFLTKNLWRADFEIMNNRKEIFLARSTIRDILKNKFFHLLQYHTFSRLVEILLEYDKQTRYSPHLKPLDFNEVQNYWAQSVQNCIQDDPSLKSIHFLLKKALKNPFEIHTKDIKDAKNFIKIPRTASLKELKDLIEKFHPKKLKNWQEHNLLFYQFAETFKNHWRDKKNKNNLMQIDDLELMALDIFRKKPALGADFSKNWDFWFIDEYQDISPVQEELIHCLTQKAKKTWAVGDPQQSIYLFRRADPQVFERRKKIAQNTIEEKHINHRAEPHLISFFNDFFKDRFRSMSSEKKITPVAQDATQFLSYQKSEHEEHAVAQRLNELIKQGVHPGNIAILLRTNQDVFFFGRSLKKLKFPVQAHSSKEIKREILDILFVLRFLINPFDNQNLIGLLRTPYFYIPDDQLAQMVEKNQVALWIVMNEKHPSLAKKLNNLIKKSKEEGYSEALLYCLDEHSMIDLCFYQDQTGSQEVSLWSLITELKNKERDSNFRHVQFVEDHIHKNNVYKINERGDVAESINPNFTQIMTIHQAKGLEFDHVILPKIEKTLKLSSFDTFCTSQTHWLLSIRDEKDLPLYPLEKKKWREQRRQDELLELDRLLYVAMTRAKKSLTFIYPDCFSEKKLKNKNELKKTWLDRFDYLKKIQIDTQKKINSTYSIEIKKLLKQDSYLCATPVHSFASNLKPYPEKKSKSKNIIQSSSHSIFHNMNTLWSTVKGRCLHDVMYKLSKGADKEKILNSFSSEDKEEWSVAIDFSLNLTHPPMKFLLKQGDAEWSFIYEKNNHRIHGRVDLWGEVKNQIWIIDYKSTINRLKKDIWKQLEFYGFVIQEQNPGKKITLCVIQPFSKKCEIQPFTSSSYKAINQIFE